MSLYVDCGNIDVDYVIRKLLQLEEFYSDGNHVNINIVT